MHKDTENVPCSCSGPPPLPSEGVTEKTSRTGVALEMPTPTPAFGHRNTDLKGVVNVVTELSTGTNSVYRNCILWKTTI